MKRSTMFFALVTVLAGAALSTAALAGPKEEFAARGAKLFADPGLGTNGKSCTTCHGDASAFAGKPRFPKFALGGVHTLDQAIQLCIANAIQGRALAPDDERLTALAVHVDGLYGTPGK